MSKKILIVEDDPFLIDIYSTKLKGAGFEVDIVQDGEDVLAHLEETKPDLLVLDIVLPHMDGWEILSGIKNGRARDLKVIVLSNLGQREEVQKGLKLGAVKYLIKANYTPSEIVKEIQETLS